MTPPTRWSLALVGGLGLVLLYAALPAEPLWLRELVVYCGVEAAAVVAVVWGVRRYRPDAPVAWLAIGAGIACFLAGDLVWALYELDDRDPFPSPADGLYLAGYPLIAVGLAVAVDRRRPLGIDRRAWIDAAIVTTIAALVAWIFLIRPVLDDGALSSAEALVAVAYPMADLLLLGVAARFVMGSSWDPPALRLLVGGLALMGVGDVMFALALVDGSTDLHLLDTILLLSTVLIGAAALHPSMVSLTREAGDPTQSRDGLRVVLLAGAVMVPPSLLLVQEVRGENLHLGAAVTAMVVLALLVALRAMFVTGSLRRAAGREATLSRYAAALLAADGVDQLVAAAGTAAGELVGDGQAAVLVGERAARAADRHAFTATIDDGRSRLGVLVADASPARLRRIRDSLSTVATQLSLAIERDRLLAAEREAAETLSEQNERLRELDRMKDTFVSSVSHELRTPLTSMVGYLEILRDGEAGPLSPTQERYLGIVDRNCHRLNDLIGDILVSAKVESGQFSLDREEVDLAELAATHVESMAAAARGKGVDLVLDAADPPGPISGDRMRLGQLLDNLLSNAVKFTPAGGSVTLTVARRGESAHLEVTDTGVGIPADELERLFDRFFRASTARSVGGTGLGLSIARSIAEAHGGSITVRSEVGVGTTFEVDLPLLADTGGRDRRTTTEVSA